ncbi:hypothetical protein [Bradyrhizobium sp.]|uniref:hypothetical protein n=1 Tax=Bradyrhizobium sp. TaxID=376 RepID=UPI003C59C45A
MTASQHMTREGWDRIHHLNDTPYTQRFDEAEAARKESLSFQWNRFTDLINGIQTTAAHLGDPALINALKSVNDVLETWPPRVEAFGQSVGQSMQAVSDAFKSFNDSAAGKMVADALTAVGHAMEAVGETFWSVEKALFDVVMAIDKGVLGTLYSALEKIAKWLGYSDGPNAPKDTPKMPAPDKDAPTIWPDNTESHPAKIGFTRGTSVPVVDDFGRIIDTDSGTPSPSKSKSAQPMAQFVDDFGRIVGDDSGSKGGTVTGTVEGQATITVPPIEITPSQWFVAKIASIENAILSLKGQLGNAKTGVNMPGSSGAKPVYTGVQ